MLTILIDLRDSCEYTTPKSTSKYKYQKIVLDKNATRYYDNMPIFSVSAVYKTNNIKLKYKGIWHSCC